MARREGDHEHRPPDVSIQFDGDASAPRKARAAVRPLVSGDGDPIADDVEIVTSELVSNVVQHTDGGGTMKAWDPKPDVPMRLEVADQGGGEPRPLPEEEGTESGGRGLRIVDDVADDWGVEHEPGGKKVWAEFDRDAR